MSLKGLLRKIENKIWFATVNQVNLLKLKYRLYKYEKTLSPEMKKEALTYRALEGKSQKAKEQFLLKKAEELNIRMHRVTEMVVKIENDEKL